MTYLCQSLASFLLLATATHGFRAISTPSKLQVLPRSVVSPPHQQYSHVPLRQPWQPMPSSSASDALTPLFNSNADADVPTDEPAPNLTAETSTSPTKIEKKIASRKKRVETGYGIAASAYAAVTCIGLVKYRTTPVMAAYIAAGPWMASAVAFHLVGKGEDDRLGTGACKRLNLALASFGFVGLLSRGIITTARPLWIVACLVAMVNSIKGYGYGLKGWDLKMMEGNAGALRDIVGGTTSSVAAALDLPGGISGVFSRSAGYAALAITFGAMKFATLCNIAAHLFSEGPSSQFVLFPLLFQYKKLLLLTVATFTLKEAVDQNDDWPKGWGAAPMGLGLATSVATGAMAVHSITKGSLYLGGWIGFLTVFSAVDGINRWTSINLPLKISKKRVK